MSVVVDCSLAMAWCFEDESSAYADAVLDRVGEHGACVPGHWHLEVANVLLGAERKGRLSLSEAAQFLHLVDALSIEIDPLTARQACSATQALARLYGLSSYDAAYLELSVRRGLPLATLDDPLRKAAQAAGVEVA